MASLSLLLTTLITWNAIDSCTPDAGDTCCTSRAPVDTASCFNCALQRDHCQAQTRNGYHFFPCGDCSTECCTNFGEPDYGRSVECCEQVCPDEFLIPYGSVCERVLVGSLTFTTTFHHYKIDLSNLTGYPYPTDNGTIYIDACNTSNLTIDIHLYNYEYGRYESDHFTHLNLSKCKHEWTPYQDDTNDTEFNVLSVYSRYGEPGEYKIIITCPQASDEESSEDISPKSKLPIQGIVGMVIVGIMCIIGISVIIHCICKRKRHAQPVTHQHIPQVAEIDLQEMPETIDTAQLNE